MKLVTDPKVLAELRGSDLKPVTDPGVLAQLNGQSNSPENPDSLANSPEASFAKGLGSAAKGTAADLATVGQSIGNLPGNIVNSIRGLSPFLANHINQQNTGNIDFRKLLGADQGEDKSNPLAYGAGKFLGNAGAFIGGGEALDTARGLAEGAPSIGKAAQYLGGQSALPTMARLGAGGALYGAGTNPQNPLAGGAIGGTLGAAAGGLGAGISKLMPSNFLRGSLSPEQLAKNSAVAGNTQTSLGEVLESPSLQHKYANRIAVHPGSGADAISANVKADIENKGQSFLDKYLGKGSAESPFAESKEVAPEEVPGRILDALKWAHAQQQAYKNSLYDKTWDIADKSGLKLDLPGFSGAVKKYSDLINSQDFLKFEPESKAILQKMINYKKGLADNESAIVDASGKPFTTPKDFNPNEMNILSGKLNALGRQYRASPAIADRNMANVLGTLGGSLKSDIKNSIEDSGNAELKDAFSSAEKNYKENFVPFLDKDLYKYTHGNADPEKITQDFIKTGNSSDRSNQLQKLMEKLKPEDQDLIKYSYFSRAMRGEEDARHVDPKALKNLWSDNKLGQNQKKALIPDKAERKQFDDYSKLVSMNTDNLDRMFNPQTGKRALEMMHSGGQLALKGLFGGAGIGIGGYEGGTPGATIGGLAGMAAPALGARYLTKKLTDPAYRNALIQKMLNPSQSKVGTGLLSKSILANIIPGMTQ